MYSVWFANYFFYSPRTCYLTTHEVNMTPYVFLPQVHGHRHFCGWSDSYSFDGRCIHFVHERKQRKWKRIPNNIVNHSSHSNLFPDICRGCSELKIIQLISDRVILYCFTSDCKKIHLTVKKYQTILTGYTSFNSHCTFSIVFLDHPSMAQKDQSYEG